MRRPVPRSHPRSRARTALLAPMLLIVAAACAGEARTPASGETATASDAGFPSRTPSAPGAAAGAAPAAPVPSESPARDADQRFLHRMLDHHEALVAIAHEQMMNGAGHAAHGGVADPAAVDGYLDGEKRQMLALLVSVYGESYSPNAARGAAAQQAADVERARHDVRGGTISPAVSAKPAATPESMSMAGGHGEGGSELANGFREGAALVDRFRGALRRPEVRALADQIRQGQLARVREWAPSTSTAAAH